jgi:hypothetical protein
LAKNKKFLVEQHKQSQGQGSQVTKPEKHHFHNAVSGRFVEIAEGVEEEESLR